MCFVCLPGAQLGGPPPDPSPSVPAPEGTAPRPAASSRPPQPRGSEHVRPRAQLPLVPNVHLVLGLGQHEGAGGQAQPSLGRCGLWAAGAAVRALGPIWRFGLILTFPQLLFMLHAPVLEPRFHLILGRKKIQPRHSLQTQSY